MTTQFAAALKKFLRERETVREKELGSYDCSPFAENNQSWGSTQTGQYGSIDVNWKELDAAIDAFCATFKKEKP